MKYSISKTLYKPLPHIINSIINTWSVIWINKSWNNLRIISKKLNNNLIYIFKTKKEEEAKKQ